jgi:hypothetical protein
MSIYDEAGNNFARTTGWKSMTRNEWILMLNERPEGRINKFVAAGYAYFIQEGVTDEEIRIYMDIDIPVPDDGEKIEYAEPLVIYTRNGIVITVNSIEREGDTLIIMRDFTHIYERANGSVIKFTAWLRKCDNGVASPMMSEIDDDFLLFRSTAALTDENIENQSVRLFLTGLTFEVFEESETWEIYFGG